MPRISFGSRSSTGSGSDGAKGDGTKHKPRPADTAPKKSSMKSKKSRKPVDATEEGGWMTMTGPMKDILGMLWTAAQAAFPGVLPLKLSGTKEEVGMEGQNDSTISSLLKPLVWIDWLLDLEGKVRDRNPLLHEFLKPFAGKIGAGENTGIAFLLFLLLMWIVNHYTPTKAIHFALAFVFAYLYGVTRVIVNKNEKFLGEDEKYTLALKAYNAGLSSTRESPKIQEDEAVERFNLLWDAQDLIGTYVIMSGLHTWSNYVYDLTDYAQAWYLALLPVLLTTQYGRKSVTNFIVTGLGLPSILNAETQQLETGNQYLNYMAKQIQTGLPPLYAYLYMIWSLTMLNTIVIVILLLAGTVGLFFSGLQNYHVAYLLAWGILILDSIIRISVMPRKEEVKQPLLVCCNLLCTWTLLNIMASFERIPMVVEFLAHNFPAYLVYKGGVVILLIAWYGIDTDLPIGPFGTMGGRGFANRMFLLINQTYIRDREKERPKREKWQKKLREKVV